MHFTFLGSFEIGPLDTFPDIWKKVSGAQFWPIFFGLFLANGVQLVQARGTNKKWVKTYTVHTAPPLKKQKSRMDKLSVDMMMGAAMTVIIYGTRFKVYHYKYKQLLAFNTFLSLLSWNGTKNNCHFWSCKGPLTEKLVWE